MSQTEKQSLTAPTPSGGGAHRAPHAQRYAMRFEDEVMCMTEVDDGGYVSFDDYETLRQQYDHTAAALLAARRGEERDDKRIIPTCARCGFHAGNMAIFETHWQTNHAALAAMPEEK